MNDRGFRAGWALLVSVAFILVVGAGGCSGSPAPENSAAGSAPAASQGELSGRYIREVFPEVDVTRDILYASRINEAGAMEDLKLDLYEPRGDALTNRPAVIFVHGGGFTSGDKSTGIEQALAERLARKGYVTLSINYRLRRDPSADWPATFSDAAADAYSALEWLVQYKDQYRIDANHIAFGGHSAGSNIVTELCYSGWSGKSLKKSCIFAVVTMAGPQMIRGAPAKDDPFCVIIHGTKDDVIPYALSEDLARIFDRAGTRYVLYPMPEMNHDLSPAIDEVDDVVTQYLYKELTGSDAGIRIRKYQVK